MPRDYWRELRRLIEEIRDEGPEDVAAKASRALRCYNMCVVAPEEEVDEDAYDDLNDLFEDF